MQPETATLPTAPPDNDRRKFLIAALNGTTLYVLAYYVVWGLHQLVKLGLSDFYHLRGNLDPSRIVYTMADGEWWPMAIILVHAVGPIFCFIMGLAVFRWYWKRERARRGQLKLLLLWVTFHCINTVFGSLLADTFTHTGFWYVPEWVFQQGNAVNIIFALLAGLIQLGLGYLSAVAFLQAHDSKTVMRYHNRQMMVAFTLIIPWMAGSAFIALAKLSYFSLYEGLHLLMMGLLIVPMSLGCLNEVFSDTVRRPQATHASWGLAVVAVVVALLWQYLLSPPFSFG